MIPKAVRFVVSAGILALSFVISLRVRAQVSGASLSGTIADGQGAAVPIAMVSVKNVATGVSFDVTTNGVGFYTVPNLTPGDYEVSVTAPGFSTVVTKVTLTVGAKQEVNLTLSVGQLQEAIEVIGAAPLVETSNSTISGHVAGTEIRELPLNGRDWASLATLQPGVIEARTHLDVTHVGGGGGRGFGNQLSVGGGRPTQNSYRLDGAIVNDYSNAGPGSVLGANLGVDAIQEFTVLTSNYSAEYGFTSGGVINAVTKSGTNAFHGTAFDFLRNDVLDATNFFNNANGIHKSVLRQNQFGLSAGGPIVKNKVFLFGDYEGIRYVRGVPSSNTTLSSAAHSSPCTSGLTAPCASISRYVGSPPVPVTTTVSIDPIIQKFLAFYPMPTPGAAPVLNSDGTVNLNVGLFNYQGANRSQENFYTTRGDWKLANNDSLFATFVHDNS